MPDPFIGNIEGLAVLDPRPFDRVRCIEVGTTILDYNEVYTVLNVKDRDGDRWVLIDPYENDLDVLGRPEHFRLRWYLIRRFVYAARGAGNPLAKRVGIQEWPPRKRVPYVGTKVQTV